MNQRIAYLSQIIEKIGAPLLISILEASMKSGAANSPEALKDDAQKLAELLSRTVLLSIDLGKMIEIEKSPAEYTESLRVAMAGLAGPMVASQYTQLMKTPAEADLKKLSGALEAVLTFSDNFAPSPENAARLDLLKANGTPSDSHQITIQYIQAFVPVADAIATFPFGQSEKKMMQDAADRINGRAHQMTNLVYGNSIDSAQHKLTTLSFVKALADIYSHCHRAEMNTMMALRDTDASAQQKSLQTLWDNFEMRAAMIEALANNLSGQGASSKAPAPQQVQQAPQSAPVQASPQPVQTEQPASQMQSAPPTQQSAPPAGNPMSMFAKPKEEPAAPPLPEQPPAAPPPPAQPEAPPAQQSGAQAGGNPMAFFKSPPQEGQGE